MYYKPVFEILGFPVYFSSNVNILRNYFTVYHFYVYFFYVGTSDPYCQVSMGSQEHKTKVIPRDLNPKWNSTVRSFFITVLVASETRHLIQFVTSYLNK